ncbi:hypothetical protein PFICI_15267 [Pestalotiopsis fici W106-1]|uniref:SGNH hydrolase-type esterase domain-containing protein n=1 Tax=Pestalotiopsis fici (strain W106-1 / CGMCC3.15140) TaxID=1229662 RepID=W3WIV2_PESFW|nr:uncharacterized protein PFICI_15267 [Pestalotiopsis fici W106-1]ETS73092.1 hypothetical protein PFICI_15267 [Pestalotiopsis fici W106-1]
MFKDATLRQTVHLSVGGGRFRFQLSNAFGGSDLPITAASLAFPADGKAGANTIDSSHIIGLSFNGSTSTTIPKGQVVYTDAVDFPVPAQSVITVTLYLQAGQTGNSITGHPGSRTTSWMQGGNHVNASAVTGASTVHWYFLSAVEAWADEPTSALVILGDSITDGRGSTDNANNRWPDLVLEKMQKSGVTNIASDNQAAGGNTVLSGGLGPPLMQRYKRDLLQTAGVKYAIIFEGVNDIGGGSADSSTQSRIGDQLISSFQQIASDAHKAGIIVFGATITPFGGNGQSYSNPTREATRQRVNNWILGGGNGSFDAAIDFAKVLADPGNPANLASQYDSGDHLHPNPKGYQAIADAFPLTIFNSNSTLH